MVLIMITGSLNSAKNDNTRDMMLDKEHSTQNYALGIVNYAGIVKSTPKL